MTPAIEIAGFGSAYDAHAVNMNTPASDGARAAIRLALQMAGIDPTQVACIIASASGSRDGDAVEAHALQQVFGDALPGIPICAPKAAFGEMMGGSGSLCAIVAALALTRQCLAPTAGYEGSAYGLKLSNVTQPIDGDYALVNALGCDGNNVALVLRRLPGAPRHELSRPA